MIPDQNPENPCHHQNQKKGYDNGSQIRRDPCNHRILLSQTGKQSIFREYCFIVFANRRMIHLQKNTISLFHSHLHLKLVGFLILLKEQHINHAAEKGQGKNQTDDI